MSDLRPPAAGWYDDPQMVNTRRYWDGTTWTEHRQEKPAATAGAPPPATATSTPRWALRGFALLLLLVAAWLVVGGGWATITGGTTVEPSALERDITTGLLKQGITSNDLRCDDPGRVNPGDVSFCRGSATGPGRFTIAVTYQSNGGYRWELR